MADIRSDRSLPRLLRDAAEALALATEIQERLWRRHRAHSIAND